MSRLSSVGCCAFLCLALATCGGGGGEGDDGSGGDGPSAARTTFTGNLSDTAVAAAALADVDVCVGGTSFCTVVGADGVFTLAAGVGGDVTLVFTGVDFTARVALTGIPLGAMVRLRNVRCSTSTGLCESDDFEIEGGDQTPGGIRCEHAAVHVVHGGTLVIDGDGKDCIRTAGQCAVRIDADRIVLTGCETCVDATGGSEVTLAAGAGGIECHADEDGVRAGGNAAVHLVTVPPGDVTVVAGEIGIRSEGTASVDVAGDECAIDGGESALRGTGNAAIDTSGCATTSRTTVRRPD